LNEQVNADKIGLTGNNRAAFVDSGIPSCQKAVSAMPEAKNIAFNNIADYCRCYSNSMADRISLTDLKRSVDDMKLSFNDMKAIDPGSIDPAKVPKRLQVVADAAGDYCIDKLTK